MYTIPVRVIESTLKGRFLNKNAETGGENVSSKMVDCNWEGAISK